MQVERRYGHFPLLFEANVGQTDKRVNFLSRGAGYTLFLTPIEAVMTLRHAAPPQSKHATHCDTNMPATPPSPSIALRMRLRHANPYAQALGEAKQVSVCNYFIGKDKSKWRTNVATFGKVRYENAYRGVDLLYYGSQGEQRLEYDFIVKPHQDYKQIALQFAGAKHIRVTQAGDLKLTMADGEVVWKKPLTYQADSQGARHTVASRYVLNRKDKSVRFAVGRYDHSKTLVLDPFLTYATYLGGSNLDQANGVAVDNAGNMYVAGATMSADFPTTLGAVQRTYNGLSKEGDAFVTKFDATGGLVYSTYLGGSGDNQATGIAVDGMGNAYVTGNTTSSSFPVTQGCSQPTSGGSYDAFVTKLNPDGTALVYSTYLGGSGGDTASSIALDANGNAYVTGNTGSANFPVTGGAYQTKYGLGNDAFVTKVNATGSALLYSTYLGGSGTDYGTGIAVDSMGNAYVTGYTGSPNFPVTSHAYQTKYGGSGDLFVTKLNSDGTALAYSTFLGGSGSDYGFGIAVDSAGCAYLTGDTYSTDYPTTDGAFLKTNPLNPNENAFVTKLNALGTDLVYSTYLGGRGYDHSYAVTVDSVGCAFVTGYTYSIDFPLTANAFQKTDMGTHTVFVTRLNTFGSALVYSSFLGGSDGGIAHGIALDSTGNVVIAGFTDSATFPTTVGAYQTINQGGTGDAFVVKLGTTDNDLLGNNSTALLLQNSADNSVGAWFMRPTEKGATLASGAVLTTSVSAPWRVVGQGDFNGDGHTDLLWQNSTTGDLGVWFMNGTTYKSGTSLGTGLAPWHVAGVGDLNGDGKPDILWRNLLTGDIACWFMDKTTVTGSALIEANAPLTLQIVGLADINADGQLDIVFQDSGTHAISVQYLNGTKLMGTPVQIGPSLPGQYKAEAVADLDQDGFADIVFHNTQTGDYGYWRLQRATILESRLFVSGVSLAWSIAAP